MAPRGNFLGAGNRMKTSPIPVQRTKRTIQHRTLTSLNAGKLVPLFTIPLLREDSLNAAAFRFGFEMEETVEVLMNAINVRVRVFLVSRLAGGRFDGLDAINKSYSGLPLVEGGQVNPWFETIAAPAPGVSPIYTALGQHFKAGTMINTDTIETYNAIWNYLATQTSPQLEQRARLDDTLAPAFWQHNRFRHIVPDFDQAIIDGEVPLSIADARMPVHGLGVFGTQGNTVNIAAAADAAGNVGFPQGRAVYGNGGTLPADGGTYLGVNMTGPAGIPAVFAELTNNGITISLSNIELARKTQAFANLRRQYSGLPDEYLINLLMQAITIPDQMWKQPILLADDTTTFGMSKRYASDGASLTESVVNGMTFIESRFSCPRVGVGGMIMAVAEIAPEQLFERQKDPYLHATTVEALPDFLRDTLDPEKVVIVTNDEVDIDHDTPTATFGYAPLNHEWMRQIPRLGGKFYRPEVDAEFDEDRQRVWAVETQNPVLSEDFYLVTNMHYKPFVITDPEIDHFEVLVRGAYTIGGNTVFGGLLVEAEDDYAKVMEQAPMDRIEKPEPEPDPEETPAAAAARRQAKKEEKKPEAPAKK